MESVMSFDWKNTENNNYYFYKTETGQIVGQVHNVVHTQIWLAKIVHTHNDEKYLGQYITSEFAKKSIENYWNMQERTLVTYDE